MSTRSAEFDMGQDGRQLSAPTSRSQEEQRQAYLAGEWGNPLTTSENGARVLSALQTPFFLVLPPKGVAVLTTIGRKTGKRRRKCVRAIRRGDKVFLVSLRGRYGAWYQNMVADPHVRLRMRGGYFRGTARHISDAHEVAEARAAYCETATLFDRLEYVNHRRGWPTPERIRDLHARWFEVCTPVVVELRKS